LRVEGSGFRVQGAGFRVHNLFLVGCEDLVLLLDLLLLSSERKGLRFILVYVVYLVMHDSG